VLTEAVINRGAGVGLVDAFAKGVMFHLDRYLERLVSLRVICCISLSRYRIGIRCDKSDSGPTHPHGTHKFFS
jgi:hypothetical protein